MSSAPGDLSSETIGKDYVFAIKSGRVMRPKQFHIRHETVIRRDTICQTESVALLDSWVTKTASCQDIMSTKQFLPLFWYRQRAVIVNQCLCLLSVRN